MRVRHMPIHLSSGYGTLMPGKFTPPNLISPLSDVWRRADSRWALLQIFSFFFLHARFLLETWADRREILDDGQNWAEFLKAVQKV